MTIEYKTGDMFADQSEAIVNTVNCVGVMGKGVALEFKKRWPDNFKAYKKLCDSKQLMPGKMYIHDNGGMLLGEGPRYLINFPTKQHWRAKSKLEFVTGGLDAMVEDIRKLNIKSVALPPLGCGNGGLPWAEVKEAIEVKLAELPNVQFNVYAPRESIVKPEHRDIPLTMTPGRAALVQSLGEFEDYFGGSLTKVCVQKIVYFLKELGVSYPFAFEPNKHGPYSSELKDSLNKMALGNYLTGFDQQEPEIKATAAAFAAAAEFLENNEMQYIRSAIRKLTLLIEGYENPYGMELLASVHYLVKREEISDPKKLVQAVKSWNDHKNDSFSKNDILAAYDRLKTDKVLH